MDNKSHGGKRTGSGRKRIDPIVYKQNRKDSHTRWYAIPENRASAIERSKCDARKRRMECLIAYSSKNPFCACCGESTYEFLSIDHINNDGSRHRKEMGSRQIYSWLIKNNFPSGFQILCHNCNMAKGFYGKCPHRIIEQKEIL